MSTSNEFTLTTSEFKALSIASNIQFVGMDYSEYEGLDEQAAREKVQVILETLAQKGVVQLDSHLQFGLNEMLHEIMVQYEQLAQKMVFQTTVEGTQSMSWIIPSDNYLYVLQAYGEQFDILQATNIDEIVTFLCMYFPASVGEHPAIDVPLTKDHFVKFMMNLELNRLEKAEAILVQHDVTTADAKTIVSMFSQKQYYLGLSVFESLQLTTQTIVLPGDSYWLTVIMTEDETEFFTISSSTQSRLEARLVLELTQLLANGGLNINE